MDGRRDLLRHFLSTLAYRVYKAIGGPPPGFESFAAGCGPWTGTWSIFPFRRRRGAGS